MKTEQIQIRVDELLKQKSDKVFKKLGITRSYAITLFLRELVDKKQFPFKITL
jgi:addiction module RelB/DinJ family antitoxin